jgi:SOUL heme-binding protein
MWDKVMAFLQSVLTFLQTCVFFIMSPFGINYNTPEPKYGVIEVLAPDIEVRSYEPRVAARVRLSQTDDMERAQREAFGILAAYIFGQNQPAASIAMTAPVQMSSSHIAMTAPVVMQQESAALEMQFFLPDDLNIENAPRPSDDRVMIVPIGARTEAVMRFSGSTDQTIIKQRMVELVEHVRKSSWMIDGEPAAYLYNPPWTLPFLRRNEVSVAVKH